MAFRGTSSKRNWMADLNFIEVNYNGSVGVLVHHGFYNAWMGLRREALGYVKQAQQACPTCRRLICTGHSLGAAISGIAAVDFALEFAPFPVLMSNFGMPRTGNQAFAALAARVLADSQRMVHMHDIVPHVPFRDMYINNDTFYHFATEVCLRASLWKVSTRITLDL